MVLYRIRSVSGWKGSGHTMYTRSESTVMKYRLFNVRAVRPFAWNIVEVVGHV